MSHLPNSTSLEPSSVQASTAGSESAAPSRQAIALLSVEADPAAETGEGRITGQRVHVRQIGEVLAKLGWQVDLFTRKTDPDSPTLVNHSPHCRTIRLVAGDEAPLPRDRVFDVLPEFVAAFQDFQDQERIIYPLVHTHYWLSGWVGAQMKQQQPSTLWVHTCHSLAMAEYAGLSDSERPAIAPVRLATEAEILTLANRVIVTSPEELDLVKTAAPETHSVLIPGGTDLATFHRIPQSEARSRLGLALDVPLILYVGRFEARKGIDTLLQACAHLRQRDEVEAMLTTFQLVLVGDSADAQDRDRLHQQIDTLGLTNHVQFAGRISHNRLPLFYTAADVCVIPSQYEPFGLVALEAMACETPVVASNVGGLKFTVIPEETGLLVPVGDAPAFAQAIARILQNPQWAATLKAQASSHVQQTFSWMTAGAQVSDLYRRLLAESLMAKV